MTQATNTLNKAALIAANMVASTEAVRYYLNGVYTHATESGKRAYVATNGHALIEIIDDNNAGDFQGIIPSTLIKKLKLDKKTKIKTIALEYSDREIMLADQFGEFRDFLIDGRYPDYSRVFPAPDQAAPISEIYFNAAYFASMEKAYQIFINSKSASLKLEFNGESGTITINGTHGFNGVLMAKR